MGVLPDISNSNPYPQRQFNEPTMRLTIQDLEPLHADLDAELEEILRPREGLLYNMMLYQLGWATQQGEPLPKPRPPRPYALLTLLSCHAASGAHAHALPAAAAMELVHTFIEVHKDVQDGNPRQEARPSVWWVWGPGQAINVGDGLHALGRSALFRLADHGLPLDRVIRSLGLLDEACIRMCEGQFLELSLQERLDVSRSSWTKMASDLSGSVTSCAMTLGALAATGRSETVDAFQQAGHHLGLAYQVRQDIQAVWDNENGGASPRLLNKKKLYPVAVLLETADLSTKRALGDIYFKRVLEPDDHHQLLALLDANNVRSDAEASVDEHFNRAAESLNAANLDPDSLQPLLDFARNLANPNISHGRS